MSLDLLLRSLALCVVLAGVETLHGIARTVWLVPALGKDRALKLSIVTGSLLAFGVCLLLVPGIGLHGPVAHLGLGLGLAGFMALFDLALGRWVLRRRWSQALADFDPRTGNRLVFGLALLVVFPLLVSWLRPPG
ncbi:hypothetical protein F7Q92_05735 [Ideonella dechloratans]|uniref:DUF3995 domain-containing protein n=1 Tax=Ideonella dechloratans TaxID=36863 RepID=A0A643FFW8_IDEDE|nr:hypothetical protein [Ideonella dechloratans]KAB0583971.1 hypothetical protein F7Q92_05735 [Ideonella dechloratans]UFU12544.1 hypothetical protein LRM40_19365 [Ideonella dechloratans]